MKEANYVGPVAGESKNEAINRQADNFKYFKAFYFEVYMHLPSDTRFEITQRYHLDQPVYREELLQMAKDGGVEVPEYIQNGDMDPRFYTEEIYTREKFWQEV